MPAYILAYHEQGNFQVKKLLWFCGFSINRESFPYIMSELRK